MTDLEISKALALAIGWKDVQVMFEKRSYGTFCLVDVIGAPFANWKRFDYRDWNVIGPIAERYECFPQVVGDDSVGKAWRCDWADEAYTPQKAIALAVIGAAKP